MKKITLLFSLFIAFTYNSYAQFPETFEGTTIPAGWATYIGANGEGTVENWENSGGYMSVAYEAVSTLAQDWLVTPSIAITTTNSLLIFDQTDAFATDYGSSYTVRVSTGASQTTIGDFSIVDTQGELSVTGAAPLEFSPYSVDLSAYEGMTVYIAFVLEQNDGDYWFIDNVNLVNQYATAPDPVVNPNPANGATNVDLAQDTDYNGDTVIDAADAAYTFTWDDASTGDAPTGYTFNLDTVNPPVATSFNVSSNSGFTIYGLSYSETYYWQIVANNAGGDAVNSTVWSFTTEADPALSVDDESLNLFSVYPNPIKDNVKINTSLTIDSVEIHNQLGQRVMDIKGNTLIDNTIDISSLNTGVYFLSISAEGKSQSIKIIKE